ncbi:MAG TPA: hypothetical protein DEQ09_04695 [Bacteroidales bacterium]|nr:hypothetical protein [Bacteroidales bacterium]
MKVNAKYVLLLFIMIALYSCTVVKEVPVKVNTTVLPLGDTVKLYDGSLIYTLPQTVLDFTVIAEKTVRKAGPYHEYANEMLGLKDVISTDQVIWTLKEVKINPVQELDPSQFYVMKSDGLVQTNALSMINAGLIMDVNPLIYKNREFDNRNYADDDTRIEYRDMGSDIYYDIEQDTAYRLVDVDTAFVRIPYVLERRRQLGLSEQAEHTARILLELREGRHLILTGEATVFPQNRAAIDEINRIEDQYISLFAGKSYTGVEKFYFSFVPDHTMKNKPVVIFRFSNEKGVLDMSDLSGRPVVIEMMSNNELAPVNMIPDTISPGYDKIYYRIPEIVDIRVTDGRRNLGGKRQLIYQFGKKVALPANYILGK